MSRTLNWRSALALGALVAFLAVPAVAQEYGSLFGTTRDEAGDALPGVTITLTGGGAPKVTVTNAQGEFRILGLDPGSYGLTAQLDGFATLEQPVVRVGLNRSTTLEITMNAAIEETITVTSETPLLDERRLAQGTSISNVELEKIPTARDPWAVLNQAPGVVVDRVNVGGNESGQQSVFRGPGVSDDENDFQVDGVQITDMAAIGASPTYYDFDQFEAVELATGGTDVAKTTAGVSVNLVTKRGTNEFRGSARLIQSKDSFFGDVFGQGTTELASSELGPNQSTFSPRSIQDVREQGLEAGGPVWKDRLWFWASYGRNDIEQVNFGGGADNTILENYSFKVNAQVSSGNSLVSSINVGDKKKSGRGAGTTRPDITTWNQRGPTDIIKFEDTHVFNSNFYLTGQLSKVDGGFSLLAKGGAGLENPVAPYIDAGGVWRNTYWSGSSARPSEEVRIDGSYFFNTGDVSHELKFGGRDRQFESFSPFFWPRGYRSRDRANVFGTGERLDVDGRVDFFRDGVLPLAADYASYWVQDTLSKGNWTINAGFRWDIQEGLNSAEDLPGMASIRGGESCVDVANGDPGPCDLLGPTTGAPVDPGFEWDDITPRIGVTYALGEERKTLLRGSYSQFPEALETADFSFLSTSASTQARYFYEELGDDGSQGFQPGIDRLLELNRLIGGAGGDNPNVIDPGLDAPLTSEIVLSVEHAFLPEFVVGANFTMRETDDLLEFQDLFETPSGQLVTPGRDSYIIDPDTVATGTLPDGTVVTNPVYTINPALGLIDTGGQLFTNGPRAVDYQGFGVNFTKRLANRWMLRGFFNFGDAEWDVPDSFFNNRDPNIVEDRGDVDGETYFVESSGSGRGNIFLQSSWQWNLTGMYQVAPDRPWGFNVSANIYGREGYPIPYFDTVTADDGFVRETQLAPVEQFRTDDLQTTDLRIEKEFAASGNVNLTFGIDIFNVFDEDYILAREPDLGAGNRDEVQDVLAPRVWKLGVRVGWR